MTISRKSLADTYDGQDAIIESAQTIKRDATQAYRKQLDAQGMDADSIKAEVAGFKVAYRRVVAIKRKGVDEVEHHDAIADEIFAEITAPAPRATRSASVVPDYEPSGQSPVVADGDGLPSAVSNSEPGHGDAGGSPALAADAATEGDHASSVDTNIIAIQSGGTVIQHHGRVVS